MTVVYVSTRVLGVKVATIVLEISDRASKLGMIQFGVPQGSTIGLVLLNLYVADLKSEMPMLYLYADDTIFYPHTKVAGLEQCAERNERRHFQVRSLGQYSNQSNLLLNGEKTKWLLFSTNQMSRMHGLGTVPFQVTPVRVVVIKFLGVHFVEHLW